MPCNESSKICSNSEHPSPRTTNYSHNNSSRQNMEKEVPLDQIQNYLTHLDEEEDDDEEDDNQSIFEYVKNRLKTLYVENIPIEQVKELPSKAKYIMGAICYTLALAIFLYFTIQNYDNLIHQKFIALTGNSGICQNVPVSVTNSFYADFNGNWEGTAAYQQFETYYHFQFSNYVAKNMKEYKNMMNEYYKSLVYFGDLSGKQNLGVNAVLWVSYARYFSTADPQTTNFTAIGSGNLQYMELAGDPSVIFQSRFISTVISSRNGTCDLPIASNFDQANSLFTGTINLEKALNDSLCASVAHAFILPQQVSFNPVFPLYLDARSLATALAVNLRYTSVDNLVLASGYRVPLVFGANINFTVATYYDIRYPYMQPIYCMKNSTVFPAYFPAINELCFLTTGTAISLPVINHLGNSYTEPEYCDCLTNGNSTQCNELLLMASMLLFEIDTTYLSTDEIILEYLLAGLSVVLNYQGYADLNRHAYEAQAASVLKSLKTGDESVIDDTFMQTAFQFCETSYYGTCSLLTFFKRPVSQAISEYHTPLFFGSCYNVITPVKWAWDALTSNPPTSLNENYVECYPTNVDALTNAIGVASGNTSIALLVLVFIIAPIVILIRAYCVELPREQEYSDKEKTKTLDTLATLLLRVRDEHYEGMKDGPKTAVASIAEEMIEAVRYSNRGVLLSSGKFSEEYLRSLEQTLQHRQLLGKTLVFRHTKAIASNEETEKPNVITADGGEIVPSRPNPLVKQRTTKKFPKSSPSRQKTTRNYDAVNPSARDDIELGNPFPQTRRLRVLNAIEDEIPDGEDSVNWKVPYASNDITVLVNGLVHYFTNAIRHQETRERVSTHGDQATPLPLYMVDPDYAKGCILSKRLIEVNVQDLLARDDPILFTSLANSLCMHAALDGHKNMHEIAEKFGDHYSYQIGDKIFMYSTLVEFAYREYM